MRDGLGRLQRVVLVGGTSDIGLAVVARLVARRGVSEVVLAGRDPDGLARASARLTDAAPPGRAVEVHCRPLDVTGAVDEVRRQVDAAMVDPVDVVVDAVGMLPHDDRTGEDLDLAARVFDVNTTGSAVVLLHAARRLRDQGHGTLVAVSSFAAVRARPDNLVYGAAKAGYDALARGLADLLVDSGAGVLVVRPGFVRSRMTTTHEEAPMARDPDDVAVAVDRALDRPSRPWRSPVVWVPRRLALVAAGLRAMPAPVLARVTSMLEDSPTSSGRG